MRRPTSIASQLIITTVSLVATVSVLIGLATTLAMSSYLTDRLDDQVTASLDRAAVGPGPEGRDPGVRRVPLPTDPAEGELGLVRGQGVGTLSAWYVDAPGANGQQRLAQGGVISAAEKGPATWSALDDTQLGEVASLPQDGQVHEVTIGGLGRYRLASTDRGGVIVVSGLPQSEVSTVIRSLVGWEIALAVLGTLAAAGGAYVLVRRRLAPLRDVAQTAHEVSTLELTSGEIELHTRVPERLTDAGTEVGQVGSALNKLLDHVAEALEARHRSEQQVRRFVADASHELRTPLTTIAGYAELIHRRPDDEEALRVAMTKVEAEAVRMTSLVEDLLLLARLDAGRPLQRERVDVTRLLLESTADARVVAPEHQWRLDLPKEPVEVVGDELRLHQVVTNLLSNARRHTPSATTVTVAVRADADDVTITVHDDGPGMSAELAATAFERFARGDSARTREAGGAGLGLSLVRAILEAHGGTVGVRSRPGDTTFTVSLPVRPARPLLDSRHLSDADALPVAAQ